MKVLAYISSISASISIFIFCWYFKKRFFQKKRRFTIFDMKIAFPMFLLFNNITDFIFAVLKIIDPTKYRIGENVLITIVYCLGTFTVSMGMLLYLSMCMKFLRAFKRIMCVESQLRMDKQISKFESKLCYFAFCCMISSIFPLVGIGGNKNEYYIFVMMYQLSYAVFLTLFLFAFIPTVSLIIKELTIAVDRTEQLHHQVDVKDDPIRKIVSTLKLVKRNFLSQCVFNVTLYSVFSLWPFFLRKLVYFHLISCICIHPLKYITLYSVSNFKKEKESTSLFFSATYRLSMSGRTQYQNSTLFSSRQRSKISPNYVSVRMPVKVGVSKSAEFNTDSVAVTL